MSMLGSCYCGICRCCNWLQAPFLLVIRLFWGYLFFQAGTGKFANMDSVIHFFTELGIIWPTFSAYLVATVESVGGVLLFFGLFSRLAAIPLSIVMITALCTDNYNVTMNLWNEPTNFVTLLPVTYLYTSLVVLVFGAGLFSVDAIWKRSK